MFLIPWWARLLAVGLLVAACFGSGWVKGRTSGKAAGEAELAHFKAQVETEAAKQARHTQTIIQAQEAANAKISADYARKLAALPHFGVQQPVPRPGGGTVAELSCAPGSPHGAPADPLPVVSAADFDQLANLAAQTTAQLIGLQDWVMEQAAAWR